MILVGMLTGVQDSIRLTNFDRFSTGNTVLSLKVTLFQPGYFRDKNRNDYPSGGMSKIFDKDVLC